MNIVAVSGHLKKINRTQQAIGVAKRRLEAQGHTVEVIDLSVLPLPLVDERPAADYPPEVHTLRAKVKAADAVILATPEYHNSLSGALKNALDHLGDEEFGGKAVGLLSTAGGANAIDSLNAMRTILRSLHAVVITQQVMLIFASQQFDDAGNLKDKTLEERVFKMTDELVRFAAMLKGTAA